MPTQLALLGYPDFRAESLTKISTTVCGLSHEGLAVPRGPGDKSGPTAPATEQETAAGPREHGSIATRRSDCAPRRHANLQAGAR